ncbi:MAG: two-component system, OmpR family, response regulator [Clostridia bacterium]|nr:two-component system, OmpR family, response regulator [Clostridia bacterium]
MNQKILVIEDSENLCHLIKLYLKKEGFEVSISHDGLKGLKLFQEEAPDLVLLDIMLPGLDGWQVCREIRKISDIPIIMITAKDEEFEKVLGLELGADDYVVKPINFKELVARVRAVLRRFRPTGIELNKLVFPGITINADTYTVTVGEEEIILPPKELELLYFLACNPNKVFTRQQLLDQVWGYDFAGSTRTVDVHIERIRKKLKPHNQSGKLKTVWGVGYKFEVKNND